MVVGQIKEPQVRGKFPLPRLPRLGLFAGEIRYPFLGFPDFVVSRSESIDSAIAPQALPNGRCLPANATFLADRPKISTFRGIPGFPEKRGFSGKSGKTRVFRKNEVFPENPKKRRFWRFFSLRRHLSSGPDSPAVKASGFRAGGAGFEPGSVPFFFPLGLFVAKIWPPAWESGGRPLAILGRLSA